MLIAAILLRTRLLLCQDVEPAGLGIDVRSLSAHGAGMTALC
jgi:hypothetical protein